MEDETVQERVPRKRWGTYLVRGVVVLILVLLVYAVVRPTGMERSEVESIAQDLRSQVEDARSVTVEVGRGAAMVALLMGETAPGARQLTCDAVAERVDVAIPVGGAQDPQGVGNAQMLVRLVPAQNMGVGSEELAEDSPLLSRSIDPDYRWTMVGAAVEGDTVVGCPVPIPEPTTDNTVPTRPSGLDRDMEPEVLEAVEGFMRAWVEGRSSDAGRFSDSENPTVLSEGWEYIGTQSLSASELEGGGTTAHVEVRLRSEDTTQWNAFYRLRLKRVDNELVVSGQPAPAW